MTTRGCEPLLVCAALALASPALAQTYPTRPIRIE
jgi:hypothetical protein